MIRSVVTIAAVAAAFAAVVGVASLAQAQDGLAPEPGRETMVKVCSSCHAPDVVAGKQMSRPEWAKVVREMADRGADGTDAEFAQIVDYLAANYGFGPKSATPTAALAK